MRFLVDAQLPLGLCAGLAERGHVAMHVSDVIGGEAPDRAVAAYAVAEGCILLTKDDDFALRIRQPGLVVVWLRIGNASNRALAEWLGPRWTSVEVALAEGETLIEVR